MVTTTEDPKTHQTINLMPTCTDSILVNYTSPNSLNLRVLLNLCYSICTDFITDLQVLSQLLQFA